MRSTRKSLGGRLLVPSLLLVVVLSACGSRKADATPTMGVEAIFTAAYQTLAAQKATQLALTPPTGTPTNTPVPTLPQPSPLATIPFANTTAPIGGGTACDNAVFAGDVTIPDGTTLKAGEKFTKTWSLLNKGSCSWTTSYKLAFVDGEAMGGAATVLGAAVAAGTVGQVSVALTAPSSNGTYKGNWRMQNASGQPFGDVIYVEIKVGGGSAATAGPSPTNTAGPSPTTGPSPTGGASPTAGADTYRISGVINGAAPANITFEFTGDSTPSVVMDAANYYFDVPAGWDGTAEVKESGTSCGVQPYTNVQASATRNYNCQ